MNARWVALLVAVSCSDPTTSRCPTDTAAELPSGACAGVNRSSLCDGRFCIPDDAVCTTTIYIEEGASGEGTEASPMGTLADAAAKAGAGSCVVVAPGTYDGAAFVGGVSIFGAGAGRVTVTGEAGAATLAFAGGSGGRILGIRVGGPGTAVFFDGVQGGVVEQVFVDAAGGHGLALYASDVDLRDVLVRGTAGAPGHGVYADASSDVSISASLVETSAGAGVAALGATLALEDSIVRDNGGYGVAIQTNDMASAIRGSIVAGNGRVGVFASAARLTITDTEVAGTLRTAGGDARLVEVQAGADVSIGGDSRLIDSEGAGVFVDDSLFSMEGGLCSNNERGFWIQGTAAGVGTLENLVQITGVEVSDNRFVGIGGTEAAGIVIQGGLVARTVTTSVTNGALTITAGDGIQALAGSVLTADGVTFDSNERAAALFDGTGGTMGGLTELVDEGTGEHGVVVQNGMPLSGFDASAAPEELTGADRLEYAADRLPAAEPATAP